MGRAGPSPPPPRRGFAIREPTPPPNAKDAPPPDDPRPLVEPAFAASRRSLTAVSWDSKLWSVSTWNVVFNRRDIPMVCCCQLLLAVLQQALQRLDALVTSNELALSNGNLLLQGAVLLNKLPLHNSKLLKIALEEDHLLLLCAVVGSAKDIVVLLTCLIKRDLELNDL
jgi:hypothetical protein